MVLRMNYQRGGNEGGLEKRIRKARRKNYIKGRNIKSYQVPIELY